MQRNARPLRLEAAVTLVEPGRDVVFVRPPPSRLSCRRKEKTSNPKEFGEDSRREIGKQAQPDQCTRSDGILYCTVDGYSSAIQYAQ